MQIGTRNYFGTPYFRRFSFFSTNAIIKFALLARFNFAKKRQANSKVLAVARVGRRDEGLIRLTGAMVCMLSAPRVQLSQIVRYNAVVDFSCRSTAVRLLIKGH